MQFVTTGSEYFSNANTALLPLPTGVSRSNALIPIITSAGLQFGQLLGGSMLTETVFSWPGVGRYMLDAIKTKDTPAVLGSVILMSVSFSVVNLLVDILYAFVDPRIKSQYKKRGKKPALRAKKQEA